MKKFITYNQSIEKLNQLKIIPKKSEKIFLTESFGRVLAVDIIADHNSPAYPTSAMDGYAFHSDDLDAKTLKITATNPAGTDLEDTVLQGTCIKTFTGSLMPKGSDTLIPIENVTLDGDSIIIKNPVKKGFAVRSVGENYKKDEVLIPKGSIIDYAQIGVMASLNHVYVKVVQKPTLAIASTGSEILDLGETQTNNAQIRSSNHITLETIGKKYGANVIQQGIVKDDKESITTLLQTSLEVADIVVTTGGVSVGDYDFVKDVIKNELGCELIFQGVNIKPGQHILIAQKENKIIVGLPGFAISSTVTFILYVLTILFKYKNSDESLEIIEATLKEKLVKKGSKYIFSPCKLLNENGKFIADFSSIKNGSSAILTNLLGDSGLVMLDENNHDLEAGSCVKVIKL